MGHGKLFNGISGSYPGSSTYDAIFLVSIRRFSLGIYFNLGFGLVCSCNRSCNIKFQLFKILMFGWDFGKGSRIPRKGDFPTYPIFNGGKAKWIPWNPSYSFVFERVIPIFNK